MLELPCCGCDWSYVYNGRPWEAMLYCGCETVDTWVNAEHYWWCTVGEGTV